MRKYILALLIFAFCITLCGCSQKKYPVQLKQEVDQIVKIELVDETVNPVDVYVVTDSQMIADFVPEIVALPCYKYWNDPSTAIGYLHIDISYADGSVESLGTDSLCYNPKQGDSVQSMWYYIDFDAMCDLFGKHTGTMPTISRN